MASSASSFDGLDCIEYPSPWFSSVRKIEDVIKEKQKKKKKRKKRKASVQKGHLH